MGVHQPGGTVFTSGCTEWVWGLVAQDPVIDRITRNLLDRLGVASGGSGDTAAHAADAATGADS
jgi:hypothetical protein